MVTTFRGKKTILTLFYSLFFFILVQLIVKRKSLWLLDIVDFSEYLINNIRTCKPLFEHGNKLIGLQKCSFYHTIACPAAIHQSLQTKHFITGTAKVSSADYDFWFLHNKSSTSYHTFSFFSRVTIPSLLAVYGACFSCRRWAGNRFPLGAYMSFPFWPIRERSVRFLDRILS